MHSLVNINLTVSIQEQHKVSSQVQRGTVAQWAFRYLRDHRQCSGDLFISRVICWFWITTRFLLCGFSIIFDSLAALVLTPFWSSIKCRETFWKEQSSGTLCRIVGHEHTDRCIQSWMAFPLLPPSPPQHWGSEEEGWKSPVNNWWPPTWLR